MITETGWKRKTLPQQEIIFFYLPISFIHMQIQFKLHFFCVYLSKYLQDNDNIILLQLWCRIFWLDNEICMKCIFVLERRIP